VQLEPQVLVSRVPLVLPELPALTEPRAQLVLPAFLAQLAFKAQQELAQLEFKGQPERPACPVPPELQGQEQLVPRALQEPG
jgi:hypothetical protein